MSHVSKIGIKTLAQVKEGLFSGDWGSVDVDDWMIRACIGTTATPAEVFEKMMAPEDIDDLKEGRTPFDSLVCYVKVWCKMGKPKQN